LESRYDILVIGAGIMGVASAYHLQRNNPGKRILVVDRYRGPGQGNTGRSNAMFRNTFSSSDNQVISNSTIDFYIHVQDELKVDIGLQKIGYLWLMAEQQLAASEPYLKRMEANGILVERKTGDDLRGLLPGMVAGPETDESALMGLPPVEGAVFGPKCGRLDPEKLVGFYANEFVKAGGRFAFGADVVALKVGPKDGLGIEGEPFVWQDHKVEKASLAGGINVEAETVVLAGGAWENELLEPIGIESHAKAKKRQLVSVRARGPDLEGLLHTRGFNQLGLIPMVILPRAGVHFRPASEEGCFWVACEDEVNQPFIDLPEHDLERYQAERVYYERNMHPILASYFPGFRGAEVKAMWAGLYSYNTIDNLPFAFRDSNLIVVGGDSGSGIMKGDSLGRIVDALYRDEGHATLYGDVSYDVSKIGFERRDVEREEWVI
jgi:glycine/D-amino acid oxidase-like deaminating enzyme